MLNNDVDSNRRSDTALVDGSAGDTVLVGGVRPPLVTDLVAGPPDALVRAATALAEVEHEIDLLWRETMTVEDRAASERLAEVQHAVRRASRLLEHPREIG